MSVQIINIPRERNSWGWFVCSGFVNGILLTVRYDERPKRNQVKNDLIAQYIR